MKLTTLATVIALCLATVSSQAKGHHPVSVLAVRNDLFYFRVDKAFMGALVEVYSSAGDLILTRTVTHHRMLIDFYEQNPDEYTIKIKSKCFEVDYLYRKIDPAGIDEYKPTFRQINETPIN